ncbi:DNA recombination protein RmuC [Ruminococcus sp. JL13D9]|uniref:DNA recombination protein RmuC n=1 Tax=Ruminococcus sp. JL13D9 TaxID=3233381 RepID=UPI00389B07B5
MDFIGIIAVILGVLAVILLIVLLVIVLKKNNNDNNDEIINAVKNEVVPTVRDEISRQNSALRQELSTQTQTSVKNMGDLLSENQRSFSQQQSEKLNSLEVRMKTFSESTEQKLENIRLSTEKQLEANRQTTEKQLEANRQTVEKRLEQLQNDNNRQLEEMRKTVDEKLQKTLEEKMNQSFSLVNQRLEQVYKGLGEMQNLAVGVGDLKKVLSNVKTRGILGEIQLGSILTEILPPEQYEENIATKKGSKNVVEFAIKLPAEDDSFIYLPIDSKFPGDTYAALRDAIEQGDKAQIDLAAKALITTIKNEAKDIRDKYIDPPNTTEFAIMFLPFEGLYSEVVNRGMVEELQRKYKVNIAGPSTMAALLNSLQMGFKTLAVQKRSSEVWDLLGSVKQEFDKFNDVLTATQMRLDQANKELDKLVGVRTRQIQRKLKDVQSPTMLTDFSSED